MKAQRIETCAHGWIAEEIVPAEPERDAVVYACPWNGVGQLTGNVEIVRCTTWERAREWVDVFQGRGFKTAIQWEDAR